MAPTNVLSGVVVSAIGLVGVAVLAIAQEIWHVGRSDADPHDTIRVVS